MSGAYLVYGYDALCGWCYGAIPAVRHVAEAFPDLSIEVIPGGLVTGERIGPYARKVDYIRGAAVNLERVTGRRPSPAFFDLISGPQPVVASSLIPSDAVQQVKETAPEKALSFAHQVQEAHFGDGKDLNDPETYHAITDGLDLPSLETGHWGDRAELERRLAPVFARARSFGITSFPSYVLAGAGPVAIATHYVPADLERAVREVLRQAGSATAR